jgi:hypothetical protein
MVECSESKWVTGGGEVSQQVESCCSDVWYWCECGRESAGGQQVRQLSDLMSSFFDRTATEKQVCLTEEVAGGCAWVGAGA